VNGVDIASVKVDKTNTNNTPSGQRGTNKYTFNAIIGYEVKVYWTVGTGNSYQYENSFIIYYTDTPPSPTFTATNNNTWNGSNALLYKLRTVSGTTGPNYLSGAVNGDLLGSFTVQE